MEGSREADIKIGKCGYHLCKEEGTVYKCPYCGKYFCEKHINPKVPMAAPFRETDDEKYEEWKRDGHPCPDYVDYWEKEQERKKTEYREALTKAVSMPSMEYVRSRYYKYESTTKRPKQIQVKSKKKSKKKAIAIAIFISFFLTFYFFLMPNLSYFGLPFFRKPNDAPLNFSVISINSSSIMLKWENRWHASNSCVVHTLIKRREGAYPESIFDSNGITVYNGTGNYTVNTNLQPGRIYYYRAWHLKMDGNKIKYSNNYAQAFNVTKPYAPKSLILQSVNEYQIRLTWENGKGGQHTYIVRKEGSIPKNMNDGYLIWNSTGNSCLDSWLKPGRIYYYRAWHYVVIQNITQWSLKAIYAGNLTMPEPPISFSSKTIDASTIDLSWEKRDENYITIIIRRKNSPPENINDGIRVYYGTGNHFRDKNLDAGQLYYYKAWHMLKIENFSQISNSAAVSNTLTKPYAPSSFYAIPYDHNQIKLYCQKGRGSESTHIVRKNGSIPNSPDDGVVVYHGSGEIYYDKNLIEGTRYYYRAWGYVSGGVHVQFSKDSILVNASPAAPTYSEIIDFVNVDKTDEHEYGNGYVCHNFSVDVIKNAEKEGIHAGYVRLDIPPLGHAIVAFNTSDNGLIFLEPQMDYLFTEQEMQNMVANERYYIEITWWEGNTMYIEKFDYPLYGYEIDWNYLQDLLTE